MGPLGGLVVLDLTHMLSGPYGTMLLTDLGARTIKVEPPVTGEATRRLLADDPKFSRQSMGAYFLTLNRGKESVAIDLKTDEGRAVFYDLVRQADVVFDNFSPGVTGRLRIDHASLAAINPRIITCSVSGFGGNGPDFNRPAFDQVVQAMGGGMSITGRPEDPPTRSGIPIGDLGGGVFGALGVLSAVVARATTGVGQHVDVSMLDVQVSLLNYMATMYLMSGEVPDRIGNGHFVHVPYNTYRTQDGYIIIACIGDAFFEQFLQVVPHPELLKPEYRKQPGRFADRVRIDEIVNEALASANSATWLERLRDARIPCGPVNDFAEALADPQLVSREMVIDVALQDRTTVRMPGSPIKLSGSPAFGANVSPPPTVGEQTETVLRDLLGYGADRIRELLSRSTIG